MQRSVALKERGKFAALVSRILQEAGQRLQGVRVDIRSLRTWKQLILGILIKRDTRLLGLSQVLLRTRRAGTAKVVAVEVGDWLAKSKFPSEAISAQMLEGAVRQLDPESLVTYRGKVVAAIDPTDYQKRGRGRGKRGRQMEYIGQVRKTKAKRKAKSRGRGGRPSTSQEPVATTAGYTDVWAGLVLKGKQFLPLARQLFSSNHPTLMSQNQVEEAVLSTSLDLLGRIGLACIIVADRGLGRKELLIKLAKQHQDFIIRIDGDILVWEPGWEAGQRLADLLEAQPWVGEMDWDRGEEGKVPCLVRTFRGTIRYSRSGRVRDYEEATLNFVELVPIEGMSETLLLATILPVQGFGHARSIARLYAQRWAIETGFETMKGWGLDRFMVRKFKAMERLLWAVAVAYALVVLVQWERSLALFRQQAIGVLKRLTVVGRRLTVGKLAEAIGLDFGDHHRAWLSVWLE